MNPELQKELAAWLIQPGTNFFIGQTPLIVKEKLLYSPIEDILLLVAAILSIIFGRHCYKHAKIWGEGDDNPLGYIGAVIMGGGGILSFLVLLSDLMKIIFAPRLYIIEWLSTLVT